MEELGGARTHNTKSGVAHYMGADEEDAIDYVKALLSYLPQQQPRRPAGPSTTTTDLEVTDDDRELDTLIPDSPEPALRHAHGHRARSLDDGEFLEVQPLFAPNIIVGFGRVEGRSVGVVANQPMQFAGTLDIDASEKAARFVRTCDAFNIPVLTFVDVPGFLPGTDQEWDGIIRRGAKLIYAYAEATVPLVTVITRKAYGGAYDVMGSKHLGADINLAWPTAQIAVMGAQGAVNILYRKELAEAARGAARRRRGARSGHHASTRTRWPTPTSPPSAATSTPSSRPSQHPDRTSPRRCGRCAPSARRCRRRSTGTSRCERATTEAPEAPRPAAAAPRPRRRDPRGDRGAGRRAVGRERGRRPCPAAPALAVGLEGAGGPAATGSRPRRLAGLRPPPLTEGTPRRLRQAADLAALFPA